MTTANVMMWGRQIGTVAWLAKEQKAIFSYTDEFMRAGIQVAPLVMPTGRGKTHDFALLEEKTFKRLPGLVADSLPDSFGGEVMQKLLAERGVKMADIDPVERLLYIGKRGMGALEFQPSQGKEEAAQDLEIGWLRDRAAEVMRERQEFSVVRPPSPETPLEKLLAGVMGSAGGAKPKALVAWNKETREIRSGQVEIGKGFDHVLVKFDLDRNGKKEDGATTRMEYAYYKMAQAAGVQMQPCELLRETDGSAHFVTRRFDREDGEKLHFLTLCGIAHMNRKDPANSYEQVFSHMRKMDLPVDQREQMARRMVFNVMSRNQDDHAKNTGFLMNKKGEWKLAPAFDLTWCCEVRDHIGIHHEMSINGKNNGFMGKVTAEDLLAAVQSSGVKAPRAKEIILDVGDAVRRWPEFAQEAQVDPLVVEHIQSTLRVDEMQGKAVHQERGDPHPLEDEEELEEELEEGLGR